MTVKKNYKVGDTVWIYGINRNNVKPIQGKVIKIVDLRDAGYAAGDHYIIEVPTHIEPLLEIRTWHNISQDENGPIGSFRTLNNIESTIKFANTVGFVFDNSPGSDSSLESEDDEVSPEQIHAALEQSQKNSTHQPLDLKEVKKPKRRFVKRKTKND